ncbi:MAG TPA: UDP-N-acetylmuramoyl-L-alanine--D-glutamate ligase [Prochlorococcaceae cyanobacterium AMR_MDS_5431]|nr:UDP-N-acetylmuramoyl-L-alanine--D-glutamate ligase [Prochlorococcaceae cyanobacterium AMR_MDS_5431]
MAFVVVLGLGKSGIAAARLLMKQGKQVVILEERNSIQLNKLAADLLKEGIKVSLGVSLNYSSLKEFLPLTRIITSPGIFWNHPALNYCREQGIPICGDTTLAWEVCRKTPWIAITGTNGKTTVTHLVGHILSYAGLDAPICGNIGIPVNEVILSRQNVGSALPDWLVVELSSYQIESTPALQPQFAIWTTLTPDHLERHGTLVNYRLIKRSLVEKARYQILNGNDPDLRAFASMWPQGIWVTTDPNISLFEHIKPTLWIEAGQVTTQQGPLFSTDCLAMLGDHNQQNLLMATAVGMQIDLEPALIEKAFRCFPGVPHRLELIRSYQGICFYNDSKATNFDAAESGVKAVKESMVVIAGGQTKCGSSKAWIKQLRLKTRAIILFGEARREFSMLLEANQYKGEVYSCLGLEEAVPLSLSVALRCQCQAVLFSPACASFDQYKSFEERGDDFREKVNALTNINHITLR